MNNRELLIVAESGILNATNKSLDVASAYKVVKFRQVVKSALSRFQDSELNLLKECGINDPSAFDEELGMLREKKRTKDEEKRFKELAEILGKYLGMRDELLKEDADVSEAKVMPYEQWHAFLKENESLNVTAEIEDLLEGILWVAPAE